MYVCKENKLMTIHYICFKNNFNYLNNKDILINSILMRKQLSKLQGNVKKYILKNVKTKYYFNYFIIVCTDN